MTASATASVPKSMIGEIWELVRVLLQALALAMVLRFAVAQPFRIPSGSMQPTLQVGDYIVVTKWTFGYSRYSLSLGPIEALFPHGRLFARPPERGDVVVFRPPPHLGTDYIKRVIGLPGDRIQMTEGVLHINGQPVQRERLRVTLDCPNAERGIVEAVMYRETLPNGVQHLTCDEGRSGLDNTREFLVPEGHYFMMGDDRDNSADSRTGEVGFVPLENLVGPAQFTAMSFDSSANLLAPWTLFTGFRGDRFMKGVE